MAKNKWFLRAVSILCAIGLISPLFPPAISTVGVKAEENGAVEVSFDSIEAVKSNFDFYWYSSIVINGSSFAEGSLPGMTLDNHWGIESDTENGNCLVRKNTQDWDAPQNWESLNGDEFTATAQLVYKTRQYKNFEMEIEYYRDGANSISPYIGFGAKPGKIVNDDDNKSFVAVSFNQSGYLQFFGNKI